MKKLTRREDFKVCPICGGRFNHGDDQSECLQCFFVLQDECCYTSKGKKILKMSLSDWHRKNCKLNLEKSECPKLIESEYFDCQYCANHLPSISPKVFAFQCSSCGYRRVSEDVKIQKSPCERCSNGIMMSKDLDNNTFQDQIEKKDE